MTLSRTIGTLRGGINPYRGPTNFQGNGE